MKLFSKIKKTNVEPKPNAVSKGMHAGYKPLQGGWAKWMMKRTEKFSRRTWVVLLVLFVLSTSTYSAYLAVSAFTKKGSNSITITPIKKLKHATETGEVPIEAAEVSETEYSRIKKFRMHMDSLARSPSGKILYDSITSHRPGLMDSVRFIENYYQQLKPK
jgi:hypothetical protein